MSFYSSNISTSVLNPRFHSNNRSEFRFESTDSVYLSNLRLINVGATVSQGGVDGRATYNFAVGASVVIRNLYLYDNNTVLDSIENFSDYLAFLNYNNSNSENCDVNKSLLRHRQGFVYARVPNQDQQNPKPILVTEFAPVNTLPNTTFATTPKAFINLKDYMPLLGKLELLDTSVFKNLRLVIEYDLDGITVGANVVTGITVPQLVVDQVVNQQVLSGQKFSGVSFNGIERESVVLAQSSATGKFRLSGFNGKTVVSMLVQKAPTSLPSERYATHCSVGLIDEVDQITVSGSDLFPNGGIRSSTQRLSVLHDSFGVSNTIPCATGLSMYRAGSFVSDAVEGSGPTYDRISLQDYLGTIINKKVTSLDLSISRKIDVQADALYGQAIRLNVFCQIAKSILPTKAGGYIVQYD
jgi:hypothetical protein